MEQYKNLFNFLNFLGLCPFSIVQSKGDFEGKTSKYFVLITVVSTTVSFLMFAYTFFFSGDDSTIPRIEISYVTSILAVSTITLDYFLLQALLLLTYKRHGKLFCELMAIDQHIRRRKLRDMQRKILRKRKLLFIEIIIKSLYLLLLIPVLLFVILDLKTALGSFSFFIMLYTILYQFIYNRLFLVVLNEAVDQSLLLVKDPVSRLDPAEIVEITRRFYKCIALYNSVFKYQNLILLKCAFMILLIMFYFTVVLVMAVDFLSVLPFVLVILHFGFDVTSLITLCDETARKVKHVKMIYNAEMICSEPTVCKNSIKLKDHHLNYNHSRLMVFECTFCMKHPGFPVEIWLLLTIRISWWHVFKWSSRVQARC